MNETDFKELGIRVKHMSIISHAEGYLLKIAGLMQESKELLNSALLSFEEALNSNPNNKFILRNCGKIISQMHSLSNRGKKMSPYDPDMEKARGYFLRAINADPSDPVTATQYAEFLANCAQDSEALEYFIKVG